ncbi:MAG TPA: DUF5996 family protein [Ktedonobacteraceae bacterium]
MGPRQWGADKGEFLLRYRDVSSADSPEQVLLDFCQSTYEAGANLARWDREALERNPGEHELTRH